MRKMIEGTGKCPACGVRIGFINAYDEKREQGECPCCGKKLRFNLTSLTKPRLVLK
jgi:transcription initiation factor IIE alpha subunit